MNLDTKWTYKTQGVTSMVIMDFNADGKDEVFLSLENSSVLILDNKGSKIKEFSLGNATSIGGIYSMDASDIDGDGKQELVFGLGGARDVRTYPVNEFDIVGGSMTPKEKVLSRVIRFKGGVYATTADGLLLWRYLTYDSVKAVKFFKKLTEGTLIAAGVGDLVIYTFHERSGNLIKGNTTCSESYVVDEESGWSTKKDCLDKLKCCEDYKDCTCRWDGTCVEEGCSLGSGGYCYKGGKKCIKGAVDVCYRSYTSVVCGDSQEAEGWRYVDYSEKNGTLVIIGPDGIPKAAYPNVLYDKKGTVVPGADNRITDIFSAYISSKFNQDLITASSNGQIVSINTSNTSVMFGIWVNLPEYLTLKDTNSVDLRNSVEVRRVYAYDINHDNLSEIIVGNEKGLILAYDSSGQVLWRQRIDDAITEINVDDIEEDGVADIMVSSRDGQIYTYDSSGDLMWTYTSNIPIYGMGVSDLDNNGLRDIVVFTTNNVTRYETSEFYVKKFRADAYYNKAYEKLTLGDYTTASIYVDKAISLYKEIDFRDNLPKCNLLRSRISEEYRLRNKNEADRYYNLALKYYSSNDLEQAAKNINMSRELYEKIADDDGMKKCDVFQSTLDEESRIQKKIIADGYYARALSVMTFGNYSGAIELIDKAREMYDMVGYSNETVKCDLQIVIIADKYYKMAETAFASNDFQTALSFAELAKDLYNRTNNFNSTINAADLAKSARDMLNKPPEEKPSTDYMPYLVGAILIALVAFAYMRFQNVKRPRSPMAHKIPPQEYELEPFEKEEK